MSNDQSRPPGPPRPPGYPPVPPQPSQAGRPAAVPPHQPHQSPAASPASPRPPAGTQWPQQRPPVDPRQVGAGPARPPAQPQRPAQPPSQPPSQAPLQAQRPVQGQTPAQARAQALGQAQGHGQAQAQDQQAAGYEGPRLVTHNRGLVAKNLGKRFKKRPVVRGVSLTLQRGEVVGLLGPNGAGKTTCFYMITGLMPPDYGSIVLDGADITDLPMYRRARLGIGYLPQEASIFRGLSVANNIRAVLEVTEKNRDRREAILDALLAEFSITHLRHTPALALSGGERRRVEIARALASNPHFVLLDEPFAGIDPIALGDIRDLVAHLKDRGIGVLITDHNVRETLDVIDRAYIIHDGMMLMEGAPSDIVGNEDVRRVYLGDRFNL